MGSKKLPVVYLLRTNYGDKHLIRSASEQAGWKTPGNPLAVWKLDSYPGATCEPYIPVARVLEVIEHLRAESFVLNSALGRAALALEIRRLERLIDDVEDK